MFSKIAINAIGKTQREYLDLESHYQKLIKSKLIFNIYSGLSHLSISEQITKESDLLFSKIDESHFNISLDPEGEFLTTENFADKLQKWSSYKNINFIIGGSHGLSKEIKSRSNFLFSLSRLTFPHQMAKIILLEQIYRSETIFSGKNYHK